MIAHMWLLQTSLCVSFTLDVIFVLKPLTWVAWTRGCCRKLPADITSAGQSASGAAYARGKMSQNTDVHLEGGSVFFVVVVFLFFVVLFWCWWMLGTSSFGFLVRCLHSVCNAQEVWNESRTYHNVNWITVSTVQSQQNVPPKTSSQYM